MLVSRDAIRAFGWILALTLSMVGCQGAPEPIPSKGFTDDFGGDVPTREEITVESVQDKEMLHQRAQMELRLGATFPFDLFDPGHDPHTNIGAVGGGKFQLEVSKNIYMGLSFDWTDHTVESRESTPEFTPGFGEAIFAADGYDRLSVLGTLDYDIPMTEDAEGLLLRLGMGVGMTVVDFQTNEDFRNLPPAPGQPPGPTKLEDLYQIMFRPSIGLRLPVSENLLVFGELTYDIVPERTIALSNNAAAGEERAIFSNAALIFGISFQW